MNKDLKQRTKAFAIQVIKLTENLPKGYASGIISKQLIKSATSVGANYHASQRARSDNEFKAKLQIVLEEADESLYWLEIILEMNWLSSETLQPLIAEANELTSIFVSSLKTVKERKARSKI